MAVQAVVRAFDVLKIVAAHPDGIGVTAIARRVDLHKSTVSRLLSTLEEVDAVVQLDEGTDYVLHEQFPSLLAPPVFPDNLIALARPTLTTLNAAIGEDVGLAIRDGDCVLYIDQIVSDNAVQVKDWTGQRFPLHTTSTGKLLLAWQSADFLARYLGRPLEQFASKTETDPAALRRTCQQARRQRISWTFDEFADDLNAVAAPIVDKHDHLLAAVNIYGPSYRFPQNDQLEITRQIQAAAVTISNFFKDGRAGQHTRGQCGQL